MKGYHHVLTYQRMHCFGYVLYIPEAFLFGLISKTVLREIKTQLVRTDVEKEVQAN